MTSEEIIKRRLDTVKTSQDYWLAEIALQLARLNERLERWDENTSGDDGGSSLSITRYPL